MIRLVALIVALVACSVACAGVIDVTYTVSGSPGAWDLNFTVADNLTAGPAQDIYQFGVQLSVPGIIGSPAGYDPTATSIPWTNFFNGGKPILYNNVWVDFLDFNHLLSGTSVSGFIVEVPDEVAPTVVPWFAYAYSSSLDPADLYTGPEAFSVDPSFGAGFEGTASPEPSTLGLLIIGLGIGAFLRRKVVRA
jgi:PEP-CTERM motif